jgi:histidinol-phosphatase (PHP family)
MFNIQMLFNLHTHTRFSDGSSEPEVYIQEAIRQGFSVLGFSDHTPVPFENKFALSEENLPVYCDTILALKKKYAGDQPGPGNKGVSRDLLPPGTSNSSGMNPFPEILLGVEIDFIPGMTRPFSSYRELFDLDYTIGSVHLVRNSEAGGLWFIDGPDISIYDEGIQKMFAGNGRHAVTAYYRQIQEMISDHNPDIIGHMDKVKMYNRGRYFSESDVWYIDLVDETLGLISESGAVVEVNTRGLYKKRSDTLFPGPEILKKILKLNIPVTISSDAHKPEELSFLFEEARSALRTLGFKAQWVLTGKGWKEIALGD